MLTVDEVEQIQRKKVATIIGHVFQLTYAAFFDKLVQEEKVNPFHSIRSGNSQLSCSWDWSVSRLAGFIIPVMFSNTQAEGGGGGGRGIGDTHFKRTEVFFVIFEKNP